MVSKITSMNLNHPRFAALAEECFREPLFDDVSLDEEEDNIEVISEVESDVQDKRSASQR